MGQKKLQFEGKQRLATLMFIAKAQCWKEAIIVKERTAIKGRCDLHWNKGIRVKAPPS